MKLTPRVGAPRRTPPTRRGNCYVATEALWHILGGRASNWQVMRVKVPGDNHWYLQHSVYGLRLDPSCRQFKTPPAYHKGVCAAFMTKAPSKRAAALIDTLTWQ